MRKKSFLFFLILCCITILVACVFVACNPDDSSQNTGEDNKETDASAYAGKYYEVVNGKLDKDSWVELSSDWTWGDSDSAMGTFKVDGKRISFYWIVSSEPAFEGTIGEGEFTVEIIGYTHTYKKGTPSEDDPSVTDPDEKLTVSFNVNGGDEAISPLKFKEGELLSLPTPKREGYNFLGWYDSLGKKYDNTSVMPGISISLTARWEKIVSTYEDDYVYFKPATEGKKQDDIYYYPYQNAGIHHYVYVELASDNIGGPDEVGAKNNFDLASRIDMEFSVASGYTLTWYNDSDFTSINGAQMFTLGYGSNVYFLTVSEGTRVVQRYLVDFYIKHDYYISLYSNVYEDRAYNIGDEVRVVEGETVASSDLANNRERDFEFDKWVYYNEDLDAFLEFDFSTVIRGNWSLYQTFKPKTITATLDGGSMEGELTVQPYVEYQQLPIPTKEGYDFIGWKLSSGSYFADITGYGSSILLSDENYFTSLRADFRLKKYYKNVEDDGDTISYVETVPVVFYSDESRSSIYQIVYLPVSVQSTCPVLDSAPTSSSSIFRGWKKYVDGKVESFDFDADIEEPQAVFPQFYLTTSGLVGIGKNYSFTSSGYNYNYSVSVYLPSQAEYVLTVSGSASTTVSAYAEQEEQTYTSTSSKSAQITLQGNVSTGMYVYLTVKNASGTVTLSLSGPSGYTSMPQTIDLATAQYVGIGEETTITARERSGYTFLGWYDEDDVKVSADGSFNYTFTMPNADVTYVAKWSKVTVESEDTDKGTVSQLTEVYLPGDEATVTATTKAGYTFIGWYNGEEKLTDALTYTFEMPSEDVTYTAKWIKVSAESEDTDKGTVSQLTGTYFPGDEATVTATTKAGYTFIGWYNGEEKVANTLSYTFPMPSADTTYTAKWIDCPIHLEVNDSAAGTVVMPQTTVLGESVTITAFSNAGYTFVGWYNGEEKLTDALTYTFEMPSEDVTYTAKWIKVSVESEDTSKGTVSQLTGTYFPGDEATVTATTKAGYTFIGWYNGEEKVANTLSYTFPMPSADTTYTAKWIDCPIHLEVNDSAAGTVVMPQTTVLGESVTITAFSNAGYTFVGWYNGEAEVSSDLEYEFIVTDEDVVYTAKWTSYAVTVNTTEGGTYAYNIYNGDETSTQYRVSFDLNGATGTAPEAQIVSDTVGLQYPDIPTRSGYVFAGWYDNSDCSGDAYDFTAEITGNVVLYAKWIAYSGSGILPYNSGLSVSVVSKSSSTKHYYAFVPLVSGSITIYSTGSLDTYGYLYNANKTQLTTDDDDGEGNNFSITYNVTAGTLYYLRPCGYNSSGTTTICLECDMPESGGLASGNPNGAFPNVTAGDCVELTATTEAGYTFVGWYDGEEKVADTLTYEFVMPAENVTYTAKWIKVSVESEDTNKGTVSQLTGTYLPGDEASVTATTKAGYTFIGWYNGEEKLTDALTYTFEMPSEDVTYTAKWIKVSVESEDTDKGTVSQLTEVYLPGDEVTVTATTKAGYTFIGWYNGEEKVANTLSYTFTMPSVDTTYTAKWIDCPIHLEVNDSAAGTVVMPQTTVLGESVTITAFSNAGYTFVGWYDGDTKVSENGSYDYTFTMPAEPKTYTAKWIEFPVEIIVSEEGFGTAVGGATGSVVGGETTVTAQAATLYVFAGWYNSDGELLCADAEYTFVLGQEPVSLFAKFEFAPETASDDFVFSLNSSGDGYTLTSYNGEDTSVVIPSSHNGLPVVEIGSYAFQNDVFIEGVYVPDSVTKVGSYAFSGCSGLIVAVLENGVTSIGSAAFSGCRSLEEITIPFVGAEAGKTSSDTYQYPFGYIFGTSSYTGGTAVTQYYYGSSTSSTTYSTYYIPSSLRSVTVTGGNILYGALYNCSMLTSVTIGNGVTSIGDSAFADCSGLTSVTIGNGVTSIGDSAFADCSGLTSVTLGDSVTSIGDYAFRYCSGLTSITIPDSVTSIGYQAFYNCSGLTSVTIGNGVTSIESYAFSGCSGLTSVYYTGDVAGWCGISGLDEVMSSKRTLYIDGNKLEGAVVIPDGVQSVPSYAFYYQTDITSITILDSVTSIGERAFYGCSGLTSVTIGDSVTSIGERAFYGCSGLTSVTIGDSVTSIGISAFSGCSGLTSIYYTGDMQSWLGKNWHDKIMSSKCTLYINGNKVAGAVVIPDGITSIPSDAFAYQTGITSITIPDSVTSIGDRAFYGCSGLTSVTIGNGVTSIGSSAFEDCSGLTSITIPDSVTSIGRSAFDGCSGLTSIAIPDSVTSIGDYAFYNCINLTSITIPDSVTSIGYRAFYNCSGLTSVTIGNGVTSIESYAFSGCSGLTSITVAKGNPKYHSAGNCVIETATKTLIAGCKTSIIPDDGSVTSIGRYAFYNCSGLTSITIPDSVTSIGDDAFYGCYKLVEVYNKSNLSIVAGSSGNGYVAYYAKNVYKQESGSKLTTDENGFVFYYDGTTGYLVGYTGSNKKLVLPDGFIAYNGVRVNAYEINNSAFRDCINLTSITIPDSVTSIGSSAFSGCRGLTSITIPDSVTSIGDDAFYGCSGLTSITIPDSVTSIGDWAFSYCSGLTSITISDGVTSIGDYAFSGCSGLTSITIPDSVTSIGDYAFYNCSGLTSVTIGNGVTSIGDSAFEDCSGLTSIIVEDGNPVYHSEENCLIKTATNTLILGCKTSIIPDSVTSIGDDAFSGCSGLTSITIPDSVTSIGNYAFEYCSGLTSITIPDSVTSIGDDAFYGCSGLTSITIPDSVTSIGSSAFSGCSGLTSITVAKGNPKYHSAGNCVIETATKTLIAGCKTSIIPDDGSVTSIGYSAFYNCSGLTSITIPDSVTSIGWYAFRNCSGLTSVTFENTSGWQVSEYSGFSSYTSLSSSSLSNTSTAANYLKSTYDDYYWRRV